MMKIIKISCIILAACLLFSFSFTASAEKEIIYLAEISYLSCEYDRFVEKLEIYFEATGVLYHDMYFYVDISCTAYIDGQWVEDTTISTGVFSLDDCAISANAVEAELDMAREVYDSPKHKDFVITVYGQRVDMGEMLDNEYYDLNTVSVPITEKHLTDKAFFELGVELSDTKVATGGEFTYKVYPKNITRTISGGLSHFAFTLNYDPSVMRLDGVKCYYPSGTGWSFLESGFVSDGYRVSLKGAGVKDDKDVTIEFRFVSLKASGDTELYALDVNGGDGYEHNYTYPDYITLEAKPVIKDTERGDLNADGKLNNLDATVVLKYDAGVVGAISQSGDTNGDGRINNLDAAMILKYDAGLINGF